MSRETYLPVEAQGLTEEMAQQLEAMATAPKEGKRSWEHFTPEFVGTKTQNLDVNNVLREMTTTQASYLEMRTSQPEGRVKFKTDLPIAIVHLGDLHLGSVFANHLEIMKKIKEIKDTPNVYCVLMGNLIENAIPSQFPENMLDSVLSPDQQVVMMRKIIQDLNSAGKVLAGLSVPCHEGWSWRKTGQDVNALLYAFPERKFPILENGGRLHIEMPGATYMGALYHQVGPFESNFNETHALRQMNRLYQKMECDWVAGAHRHFAAAEEVYEGTGEGRKIVAYIRTGSEKGTKEPHDMWSIGKYGSTGEPSGQTLHLWPNEKRLMTNLHFETGILCHESIYLGEMAKNAKPRI